MLQLLRLLFVAAIFVSCHLERDVPNVPPIKTGIPADAFWVGEADGGYWYQVSYVHSHRNNAFIKIFDDETRRLLVEKKFTVMCILKDGAIDNPVLIEDLKSQIRAFDGEKIYLKRPSGSDSCWLQ